jgi:4-hydroxy-3-polyprenylbenzoate decarboxylase
LTLVQIFIFYTNTSIDTLDYSGTALNKGSKVVLAAYGDEKRILAQEMSGCLTEIKNLKSAAIAIPGVVCLTIDKFQSYQKAAEEIKQLSGQLKLSLMN